MKKHSLLFNIGVALICNLLIIGCGADDAGDELEDLYDELVGTYDLFKAEVTYVGQTTQVLVPPTISGSMTISSDQRLTQTIALFGVTISISGTFEIRPDEGVMVIDNDTTDLISKATYTWNGSVLTTYLDTGAFVEKDYWRKL